MENRAQALELAAKNKSLLQESEAKFAHVFEAANVGKSITSLDGKIEVNKAFCELVGYSPEEMREKKWQDITPPDEIKFTENLLTPLLKGEKDSIRFNKRYVHKNGSFVWADVSVAIQRDNDGKPQHFITTIVDITDRINAELEKERLQLDLVQAQKMDAIGKLAGGVAHDYNNVLSVILGYTEMALERVDPNDSLHADLQEVYNAAQCSADITRQLLAFARKQVAVPKVLDLNNTLEGMLKMLRRLIGEDIDLVWVPVRDLWSIKFDPSQLDQILTNLCINARDAIGGVGKVSIEFENKTIDEGFSQNHFDFVPGEFVQLTVSDNGCGMDRETLTNIFEPFFTTKDLGHGTGLGLATVYGIVRQNNGFVNVYSEPGKGTAFKIYLPRHVGEVEELSVQDDFNAALGRGETVLIVEDEVSILKLATKILKSNGYNVIGATNPCEALILAEKHAGDIHLLITDVILPELNGRQLSERLCALYPKIKVLFMSGYTADVIARRGIIDEGVNFIQKPFSVNNFTAKARHAIDQNGIRAKK
ncbi:MAG: PAS domain S-box protein [Candidatus Riflebacteria bacterium]|nr:PAS domain S-box protein [Candidatus Riflebacteria bacterium]